MNGMMEKKRLHIEILILPLLDVLVDVLLCLTYSVSAFYNNLTDFSSERNNTAPDQ